MSIFTADCPRCGTRSVAFTIHGQVRFHKAIPSMWDTFAICGRCSRGIVATFRTRSPEGPQNMAPPELRRPSEIAPLRRDSGPPTHTPEDVGNYFRQGRDSLQDGRWDAAGMMHRKAVETGLKVKFPDYDGHDNFKARIKEAEKKGKLTSELAEWANHIRGLGNDAAHETFTEKDARTLDHFTELMLIYLFTLPGRLHAARKQAEGEKETK